MNLAKKLRSANSGDLLSKLYTSPDPTIYRSEMTFFSVSLLLIALAALRSFVNEFGIDSGIDRCLEAVILSESVMMTHTMNSENIVQHRELDMSLKNVSGLDR